MTLNGGAALNGTRLRLTDGILSEARSAFFTAPVNVQQFTAGFDFQLTNAQADGFTFTIQGDGPTFLGNGSASLGVGGMTKDVIVKFDLYNNAGEGPDSTGMYTNRQPVTVPAINLTPTGINLHSGDIFNVQMAYSGTTLTVVITDTVTNATATQTYTVNIPAIVGGTTGYVGFTGSQRRTYRHPGDIELDLLRRKLIFCGEKPGVFLPREIRDTKRTNPHSVVPGNHRMGNRFTGH